MKLELKVNSDEYFMPMILLVFVQYLLCIVVMFPASLPPNCTITRKLSNWHLICRHKAKKKNILSDTL